MFMVVMLHYLSHTSAVLCAGVPANGRLVTGSILQSLSIVAVNCYVLISGYFWSAQNVTVNPDGAWARQWLLRLFRILAEVWFYSILIAVLMAPFAKLSGQADPALPGLHLWTIARYLLPISTKHYWFVSSYVLLYLASPVLTAAVQQLSRRQLRAILLALLALLSLIPSLSPIVLELDNYGYDTGWFVCLFLIAAYLRKYILDPQDSRDDEPEQAAASRWSARLEAAQRRLREGSPRGFMCLYLVFSAATFAATAVLCAAAGNWSSLTHWSTVPLHYNAVFCLLASVSLFCFFARIRIPEGKAADRIRRIAPLTLGVYLIHHHFELRDRWTVWAERLLGQSENPIVFLLQALVSVIIVYAVCLVIDAGRAWLFRRVESKRKVSL